jgi:acetyl esterase/lipase
VVGLATSALPWGRAAVRGALLLAPVLSTSQPAAYVAIGEGVRHTSLKIAAADGPAYLDVYAPAGPPPPVPGARGGLLLVIGVGNNGPLPQAVNLADSLAESGEVVMEVTTPALLNFDLKPADGDAVVRAFQRLEAWPGVGRGRVGIVGFSAGGPFACLAAADPRIRDQVAFLVSFGGFFDVSSVLHDLGRRALEVDGRLQPWTPNPVALNVLANVLADRLPESDAARLRNGFDWEHPQPLSPDDVALLTPAGQAAYHLLAGDEPDRVDANIATLRPLAGDLLTALSPRSVVAGIRAPIYLMHDRSDPYVPFTEGRAFAADLARLHHRYEYAEFSIFQHTEVQSGQPVWSLLIDGAKLARILYSVLLVGS